MLAAPATTTSAAASSAAASTAAASTTASAIHLRTQVGRFAGVRLLGVGDVLDMRVRRAVGGAARLVVDHRAIEVDAAGIEHDGAAADLERELLRRFDHDRAGVQAEIAADHRRPIALEVVLHVALPGELLVAIDGLVAVLADMLIGLAADRREHRAAANRLAVRVLAARDEDMPVSFGGLVVAALGGDIQAPLRAHQELLVV